MNNEGRVKNSAKNIITGIVVQAVNVLLGLIVRTVFIRQLSIEYLGINGVFSNILTMLSLAEMGIGSAIVYHMYKPIAENDYVMLSKLMNLYKRSYRVIGCVIGVVGLSLTPFLDFFISDKPNIPNLQYIYLLFLSNTVLSYFFAYKRSIISADQKVRILHAFKLAFFLIRSVLQIVVLLVYKDFILYLVIQIACTVFENISISIFADRKYPFLNTNNSEMLSKNERGVILKDIRALFIYKIGSTVLDGTDNLIISATDGVVSVGLLSNYALVSGSVQAFLSMVDSSITASVGNFVAKETKEKCESLFYSICFSFFVLYGSACMGLIGVLNPFVGWWFGESYLLEFPITFIHCLNIYVFGLMIPVWTFRSTMGLFRYGKWRPLFSAVINLIVSVWWAKSIGLIGVLLGTTFTRLVTNVWFDPYIVFSKGFKKTPLNYYKRWIQYLFILFISSLGSFAFQTYCRLHGFLDVLANGIFSSAVFLSLVYVIYRKTEEYSYLRAIIIGMFDSVKKRIV